MDIASALIVDDSKMARITLKKQLESRGIVVSMAESGEDSLEFLKNNHPDIIFMDCLMPGIDGFEATHKILTNPETASIPVIMCTGKESDGDKQKAFALGAVGYMTKSSSDEPLEAILNEMKLYEAEEPIPEDASQPIKPSMLQPEPQTTAQNATYFDSKEIANIAELSAKIVAERIVTNKINQLGTQYTQDVRKQLSDFTEKFEKMVIFSVKSSLEEVHEAIDANKQYFSNEKLPEFKNELTETIEQKLQSIQYELNDLKSDMLHLDIENQIQSQLEQYFDRHLKKNLPKYALTLLTDNESREAIDAMIQTQLVAQNERIDALEKLTTSSNSSVFNPFSLFTFLLSLGALLLSIYMFTQ